MRTDWPPPADAIARFRAAKAGGAVSSNLSRGSVENELLATRDAGAYAEWLCSAPLVRDGVPPESRPPAVRGELRGLVLRDGGALEFPTDNPWRLPAAEPLEQLIRRVWAPFLDHLPAFIDRLVEMTFALAQVRFAGQDYLAYLTAAWVSRDVPHVATASIGELMDSRELTLGEVWGLPPLPPATMAAVPALGMAPLPGPLRALASVHRSVTIFGDDRYIDLEYLEPYRQFLGGRDPALFGASTDSLVAFAGHGEAWFLLDCAAPGPDGYPTVVTHDPQDGLVPGSRQPLRRFLADYGLEMLDIDA